MTTPPAPEVVPADDDGVFLDEPLVRPYAVADGRTRPSVELELLSLVTATGRPPAAVGVDAMRPEHMQAFRLCRVQTSVAEVAAQLRLPVMVTKVILADLVTCAAVTARPPRPAADPAEIDVLERLLDGLQRL